MPYPQSAAMIAIFSVAIAGMLEAAETPIAAVPAQSGLVIRFKNPAASINKVADLADRLIPKNLVIPVEQDNPGDDKVEVPNVEELSGWGDFVRSCTQSFFEMTGEGVDPERDWWLVYLNPDDENADCVSIVPVNDSAAFRASLTKNSKRLKKQGDDGEGQDFEAIDYGTWVIYGSTVGMKTVKRCLAGQEASIESRLNGDARAVFDQGDVGAIVDVNRLLTIGFGKNATGLDAIDFLVELLSEPLNMLPIDVELQDLANASVDVNISVGGEAKIPNPLPKVLQQALADTEYLSLSLSIAADEITFENYQCVKADSPTSEFLVNNPGSEMEVLSSLPSSSSILLGLQGNWKSLTAWVTQGLKTDSDEENSGISVALQEVLNGYEKLNFGTYAVAFPLRPLEQGLLRAVTITEVDDPQRARELGLKWSALPNVMSGQKQLMEKTDPMESTEKYGEFSADVVHAPPIVEFPVGDLSFATLLHGPDGNTTRSVYLKDRIVQGYGGSKLRMAAALRRIDDVSRNISAPEPEFEKTRAKLGKNVNAIVMLDAGGLAAASMQLWNVYVGLMEAAMKGANVQVAGFDHQNNKSELDEGVPPVVMPEFERFKADHPDAETPDEPNAEGDEEIDPQKNLQVIQAGGIEFEESLKQMKFDKEVIDGMTATPSFIGVSLAFEPRASRVRMVIPFDAMQQLVKAGELFVSHLAPDMPIEEAEEVLMEDAEIENNPEADAIAK